MKKLTFYVKPIWDAEAGVYYSESDIQGLHIEAETLEEFEQVATELGPQLIVENHLTNMRDFAHRSLMDMIPSIMFRAPHSGGTVAA